MDDSGLRVIGRDHPISDAARKAGGGVVYGADLRLAGLAHAKLLLSPVAHARVTSIDTSAAAALPGVIGVFSHHDAPADLYSRYRILPDQERCPRDETLFASTARFVGDRIAAVVADDPVVAAESAALIRVEYEELPPLLSPDDALAAGAPAIHPDGNLLWEFVNESGSPGAPCAAVAVTTDTRTPRVHHAALEPHLCIAHMGDDDKLTIWSPTQSVFGARTVVADLFGLRYNQVRVIKIPMGGSFGGKQEFILEPVVAFLAMRTRRPVKLVLDREEDIIASMIRPATASRVRISASRDGMLSGVDVDSVLDAGAYASSSVDYAEVMAHKIGRLYRMPYYRHRGRAVYTTTPVAGGARAYGAPEILTAMEIGMDRVAAALDMDPVELRLRNVVHPYDMDVFADLSLGDARVRECLELGARTFRWKERFTRARDTGRFRTGVGMACGAHKNGMKSEFFSDFSTMTAKMNEDGSVALTASLHEMGAGCLTAMQLIVAEELGISPDDVSVSEGDSDVTPYDFGSYGSRVTYVCGTAAYGTAVRLRTRLVDLAAALLDQPVEGLEAVEGAVRTRDGRRSLSFPEIVMGANLRLGEDVFVHHTHHATGNPGAYCAQFAEVRVDAATGLTRVTDFLAVADVGRALNPGMVRGQYHGGVQMGIGYALCEEVRLDEAGRPAPDGFKNYHLVNTPDMPHVEVLFVEHDGDDGPYSAKSVGEIATVPTAAAVVNAVNHALGITLSDLPVTPDKIMAALNPLPEEA